MRVGIRDDSLMGMQVSVVLDHRFWATPDGTVWTDGPFPYSFFTRYLDVFYDVQVVARVAPADSSSEQWLRSCGDNVKFAPVPCYVGPQEYLRQRSNVRHAIQQALSPRQTVILRAPGQLANVTASLLRRAGRAYGAEVGGDPYDAFAAGADRRVLRPLFRWQQTRALRHLTSHAAASAYVTQHALQRRYPPRPGTFTTHYSSVELPHGAVVSRPRGPRIGGPLHLITVGSMEHLYKGQDILLLALAECRAEGLDVDLTLVGDGRERGWLEDLSSQLQLGTAVRFVGQLPSGNAIREQLDQADVFVLPSRQEGVPRAMIEAMARALPCIGSAVGGIPELLPTLAIVPANDVIALATAIRRFSAPEVRREESIRNLARSAAYEDRILRERRREFYKQTALQ